MKYRLLGSTGMSISEVSLGAWQLGAKWGEPFSEKEALNTLGTAVDAGINFIDTADVYSGGLSEKAIGKFLKSGRDSCYVATKCGRGRKPHDLESYSEQNITKFVESSLKNLQTDSLDLLQLHCPIPDVYYKPEVFAALDKLKGEGKIRHYGVSVERIEEALKALEFPGVETIQIIFNIFRQRPKELLFREVARRNTGIIVRVPLASGLLTGKFTRETTFGEHDHRFFNRDGSAFDRGETFAGVPYEIGIEAVEELKKILGKDVPLSQWAIRWILMHQEVSTVIPGASKAAHIASNVSASSCPPLSENELAEIDKVYDSMIKPHVHQLW